jgi:hypothetical protein
MSGTEEIRGQQVANLIAAWLGLLLPPLAWSMQMGARYALQSWICLHGHHWVSDVIAVAAILVTLAGGVVGWQQRRDLLSDRNRQVSDQLRQRALFMATLGVAMCVSFELVIAAQWLPERILSACPQ